jgi:hypothetical protein
MNRTPFLILRTRTCNRCVMASAPEAIERFEQEGIFVASPTLTARRLREKAPGRWLASGKGGGKNAPQVEPSNLTNFIIAQAAHLPINAADAVTALRDLPVTGTEAFSQTEPEDAVAPFQGAIMDLSSLSGGTLGEWLDRWIDAAAYPIMRAAIIETIGHEWTLTLCADPPFATISQRHGSALETVTFGHRVFTGRAQRLNALPFKAIMIAAELYQDTCENRGQSFATPEDENTDALAGAPAPSLD